MARTVNGKFNPTDIISKTLVGTTPDGETKDIIKIDQVDRFDKAGFTASFIRLILNNGKKGCKISFYFSQDEDMELAEAYL